MDNTQGPTGGRTGSGGQDPREELRDQIEVMGKAAGDLLEQLVKMPGTLAQIPLQALPEDTARHARNAASEGMAAVRTLLETMTRSIDQMMKEQRDRMAAMGSSRTGTGGADASHTHAPPESAAGSGDTRALNQEPPAGTGGHGAGSGPQGDGNTQRLDDQS